MKKNQMIIIILVVVITCGVTAVAMNMNMNMTTSAPKDTTPSMLKCINTQNRDNMGWVAKGRVKTEAEARALCPNSKYMSLECPTADGFEVFCVDDISQADVLLDRECKGDVAGTPLHGGKNLHCVGPYKWGDVNGGGANRGSLYKI